MKIAQHSNDYKMYGTQTLRATGANCTEFPNYKNELIKYIQGVLGLLRCAKGDNAL